MRGVSYLVCQKKNYRYYIGLDIGTMAARCVVGELSRRICFAEDYWLWLIREYGMRKGNVAHIDEVAQAVINAISEAERMSGREIKTQLLMLMVRMLRALTLKELLLLALLTAKLAVEDRARVEEAATIVQLPANKEIIQVFAKNYRLDEQDNIKDPVGMHGVRLEVDTHILTASAPALKSLDHVLRKSRNKILAQDSYKPGCSRSGFGP
jgi:cell division protein FtsA